MLNLLTELGAHDFWLFLVLCRLHSNDRVLLNKAARYCWAHRGLIFKRSSSLPIHGPQCFKCRITQVRTMFCFLLFILLKSIWPVYVSFWSIGPGIKEKSCLSKNGFEAHGSICPSSRWGRSFVSHTACTDFKSRLCYVFQLWPFQLSITTTLAIVLNKE